MKRIVVSSQLVDVVHYLPNPHVFLKTRSLQVKEGSKLWCVPDLSSLVEEKKRRPQKKVFHKVMN